MQRLPLGPLYYEFSRHVEPRLRVAAGRNVRGRIARTLFSGQIRTDDDRRDKHTMPYSNPADRAHLDRRRRARRRTGRDDRLDHPHARPMLHAHQRPQQLAQWLGDDCPHGTHVCPIRDGQIYWSDTLTIPYAPMLGCIGTAPHWGSPTTLPAGPHGGNMDIVEVCPAQHRLSARVRPRRVPLPGRCPRRDGARRAVGQRTGDAGRDHDHGQPAQRPPIPGPRIETPDEIMTVASGCPMERPRRRLSRS